MVVTRAKRQDAPDPGLELVRAFVNTRDLDEETEALADPPALVRWLAGHGLLVPTARASAADLRHAVELREALRGELLRHGGGPASVRGASGVLDAAARRARLRLTFGAEGGSEVVAEARGVDGALGRILAAVHRAQADGTWERLKACAREECRWAFYDRTKNRSGRWCDMAVCGNRTKVRAFRERHGADA